MGPLSKFVRLGRLERSLLLRAAFLLFTVRLKLIFCAPALVREWIEPRRLPAPLPPRLEITPERIVWAVAAAGRYLPGGQGCLPQALAARILFAAYGFPAQLRIGVAKGEGNPFRAHAWTEILR